MCSEVYTKGLADNPVRQFGDYVLSLEEKSFGVGTMEHLEKRALAIASVAIEKLSR